MKDVAPPQALASMDSPLGVLLLASNGEALTAVTMDSNTAGTHIPPFSAPAIPVLQEARRQLRAYFSGSLQHFDLPVAPQGTEFQRRVWLALQDIPFGETVTYLEIATRIGNTRATRAVGAANGQNPIAIVVPCHRVVGANGALVGYSGGMHRKKQLLELEARVMRPALPGF